MASLPLHCCQIWRHSNHGTGMLELVAKTEAHEIASAANFLHDRE